MPLLVLEGGPVSGLVDARVAASVAGKVAAGGPLDRSYLLDDLDRSFAAITAEAEPLIKAETGFSPESRATARVLSRKEWANENISSMLKLMAPLLEKLERKIDSTPVSPVARLTYGPLLGAQMGVVLGFLSQKVLGQYDVVEGHHDQVWFVGPNVVLTERRFGFVPRDFRLWVAVHELTHRAQFEGNPWMRGHFLGSVAELIEEMDIDSSHLLKRLKNLSFKSHDEAPMPLRLLSPQQVERFNQLQALMSVIEGHANFVMDRVAEREIPTQPRMRATLKQGALAGGWLGKLLSKLLGLDLKRAQYRQGQEFFDQIYKASGQQGIVTCFHSPQNLPSMAEVKDPQRWLARVEP